MTPTGAGYTEGEIFAGKASHERQDHPGAGAGAGAGTNREMDAQRNAAIIIEVVKGQISVPESTFEKVERGNETSFHRSLNSGIKLMRSKPL